ncbi:3'-5' exonuclease [Aeromicrobium sp. CF3.5]|uniref:3'-5' exonuclease n=1 Tax=Aeromicrobium sp. CF3.5 TaxID=3373078 RepID=UPI003EE5C078
MSPSFAVIDVETTGLVPERSDRVVEIGVVLTDPLGRIEWEWSSLINPRRDIGPTRIHGIAARDVLAAPEFSDIADPLLDALRGRVVVAHNASFDMRFLHAELDRSGYGLPARPEALCSMKWAGRYIGAAKLAHCCEAVGIELLDAHSALGDARATAGLVAWLTRQGARDPEWMDDTHRSLVRMAHLPDAGAGATCGWSNGCQRTAGRARLARHDPRQRLDIGRFRCRSVLSPHSRCRTARPQHLDQ